MDLCARLWCVCELAFAHNFDLGERGQRTKIVGSRKFADAKSTAGEAKCWDKGDEFKILRYIYSQKDMQNKVTKHIYQLRKLED